jgi:hypothetical protein
VLPFANAFAFRWWFMAYLLVLSCYFFSLTLLPDKKFFAASVSLSLLFSPFIQWWYLYGTLGTISYALFGAVILMKLIEQKRLSYSIFLSLLLAYVGSCFILVLYPPFQIAVGLVLVAFVVGYCIERFPAMGRKAILEKIRFLVGSLILMGVVVGAYLATRYTVFHSITSTVYPGLRIEKSGGFDIAHTFSSHLGAQFQYIGKASQYLIPTSGLVNQSESSNFILIVIFLYLPSLFFLYWSYRSNNKIDWPLLLVNSLFAVMLLWLFIPNLALLGRFTLLERVPHTRLMIGLGVLNFVQLILFIRRYSNLKFIFKRKYVLVYILIILIVELMLGLYAKDRFPGFIGVKRVFAFSIPIPVIMYLILRKRYELGAFGLLAFGFFMTLHINPIYQGTSILTDTPISRAIQDISHNDRGAWATEYFTLENFAAMNGAHSLSGVYTYPQLSIWRDADTGGQEALYNRYEHITFAFDRDPKITVPNKLVLLGQDNLRVTTEPCGSFLLKHKVKYLLTSTKLAPEDTCAKLVKQVDYPEIIFYIYSITG